MRRAVFVVALAHVAVGCSDPGESEQVREVTEANTSVCPTAVVEGIDVSNGQGAITWSRVAGAGRAFAFMKATQGDYNTQTTFPANWANSKAAGVLRSPYHFFDPTIDGVKQAQHFLTVLGAAGGLQPGDLPPMLDIECPTSSSQAAASANCEYTGNSGWVATATLVQRVFDWLATVEQATGRKPIIYSYPSWFGSVGLTDARLAQYPLYIATLSTCASVPPPWTTTVFWQYSFTGMDAGTNGAVDLDRFLGTKADLIAFAGGPDAGTDAGLVDASQVDASLVDATTALDAHDATIDNPAAPTANGCSCRVGERAPLRIGWALTAMAALALGALRGRRRVDAGAEGRVSSAPRP